ncbi:sodium:dicarboxylate symporter [Erysipelotrichaceae bacterium]|nr:sodium:dicarboxylate symporter [Erysipelotrichaceae bacterium]
MLTIIKNYAQTLLLLLGVIIGGFVGVFAPTQALLLKPFGQIFLNLMFMLIVPLVFFSISSALTNKRGQNRVGKILGSTLLVFIFTALIAALLGYFGSLLFNPMANVDSTEFIKNLPPVDTGGGTSFVDSLIKAFTVSDFVDLFSKNNVLPLIMFSLLFGIAVNLVGEKAKPIVDLLSAGSEVMLKIVTLIMYLAPIGLGCFFAYTVAEIGPQILNGYLNSFVLYTILAIIYFVGFNSLYAFLSAGITGVKIYWQNITTPSLTAIATSSSLACISVNLLAAKKIGVPDDIAETVLPLGANTHRDGSVIGGVFKIVFLFTLYSYSIGTFSSFLAIVGGGLLVGLLIGSIPGGGLTAEITICALFGFPPELVAAIVIISTIIDIPATLLNSTGNVVCAMMVTRLVEGKDWLKNSLALEKR